VSGIQADFTGAFAKTMILKNIPKATKYQLTRFSADTVKSLKVSAMGMKRADKYRRKSGALARSVGFRIESTGGYYRGTIGTGVGTGVSSRSAEKYAMIQDRGGTTHPTVTKRMKGWAWYMFYRTKEEKFKWIALTKKSKLTVRIPASAWFTSVWEQKLSFLNSNYLNDRVILETAQKMSGVTNAS
jgi:hypothetical protein